MERIKIFKGDDTNFNNAPFVTITLDTSVSLAGFRAIFQLGSFRQDFFDISAKTLNIIIPHSVTQQFSVGKLDGTLVLEDSYGRYQTITNTIPFEVTNEVFTREMQTISLPMPDNFPVSITLRLLSFDYNDLEGKPSINGTTLEGALSSADLKMSYVYNQTETSNIWVIEHNLGKYPNVTLLNENKEVIWGNITHDTVNKLTVRFNEGLIGTAYLS